MGALLGRLAREEKGQVIVLIALAFTVFLGFAALGVDAGILYLEHSRLVRAADAAALAGAQELPDTTRARTVAQSYAQLNGVDPASLSISFSADNKQITVAANRLVELHFAQVLGFNQKTVNGRASARIAPVSETGGLLPLGINESMLPLAPGNAYMLKGGAHDGAPWRGIIGYGDSNSANDYRDWALHGYPGRIAIGDIVGKAPGNKSGPTEQGIQERISACTDGCTWNNYRPECPRVALIPIYRDLGSDVQVVGLTSVFLEQVEGNGSDNRVWARYVPTTVSAETDDSISNSYLYSVRLSE